VAEKPYSLTEAEKTKLRDGLLAAYSVPLIDDVVGYVWEAIFHHVKGIKLADPITEGRNKQLFDAVAADGRGWSLKTLVWANQTVGFNFEFVIQRADIFKKAVELGFKKGLNAKSTPNSLGKALVRHWNAKFKRDSKAQKVSDPRVCILMKDLARKNFTYVEFGYPSLNENDYTWAWSKQDGLGLKGSKNGVTRFKWYHGQKQLFEVFQIPKEAYKLQVDWKRRTLTDFVGKA
jgi:hypothetical protein